MAASHGNGSHDGGDRGGASVRPHPEQGQAASPPHDNTMPPPPSRHPPPESSSGPLAQPLLDAILQHTPVPASGGSGTSSAQLGVHDTPPPPPTAKGDAGSTHAALQVPPQPAKAEVTGGSLLAGGSRVPTAQRSPSVSGGRPPETPAGTASDPLSPLQAALGVSVPRPAMATVIAGGADGAASDVEVYGGGAGGGGVEERRTPKSPPRPAMATVTAGDTTSDERPAARGSVRGPPAAAAGSTEGVVVAGGVFMQHAVRVGCTLGYSALFCLSHSLYICTHSLSQASVPQGAHPAITKTPLTTPRQPPTQPQLPPTITTPVARTQGLTTSQFATDASGQSGGAPSQGRSEGQEQDPPTPKCAEIASQLTAPDSNVCEQPEGGPGGSVGASPPQGGTPRAGSTGPLVPVRTAAEVVASVREGSGGSGAGVEGVEGVGAPAAGGNVVAEVCFGGAFSV